MIELRQLTNFGKMAISVFLTIARTIGNLTEKFEILFDD